MEEMNYYDAVNNWYTLKNLNQPSRRLHLPTILVCVKYGLAFILLIRETVSQVSRLYLQCTFLSHDT